jgi:hypothetical protein
MEPVVFVTRLAYVCKKRQRILAECSLLCQSLHPFSLLDFLWTEVLIPLYRYDVSGVQPKDIKGITLDEHVFKSSRYLKEKGMPVVALSGTFFSCLYFS